MTGRVPRPRLLASPGWRPPRCLRRPGERRGQSEPAYCHAKAEATTASWKWHSAHHPPPGDTRRSLGNRLQRDDSKERDARDGQQLPSRPLVYCWAGRRVRGWLLQSSREREQPDCMLPMSGTLHDVRSRFIFDRSMPMRSGILRPGSDSSGRIRKFAMRIMVSMS